MAATPPRHAWDWFARQQLLWRHVRSDLAATPDPVGTRYRLVADREDVMACLKRDYPRDDVVAAAVHRRIDADIFLGGSDRGLEELGIRNAPRGLRWWWSAVTGRVPAAVAPAIPTTRHPLQLELDRDAELGDPRDDQLAIDEVRYGWGER